MDKMNFIKSSIDDTQATIRAIDTKVTVLMGFLIFPLANIGKIIHHLQILLEKEICFSALPVVVFVLSWIFALWVSFRAIGVINDPSKHIKDKGECNGCFYGSGLFKLGLFNALCNKQTVEGAKSLDDYFSSIPSEKDLMLKELAFEKMKLIYIRDMKLNRLKWGLIGTASWLTLGTLVYLLSRFG